MQAKDNNLHRKNVVCQEELKESACGDVAFKQKRSDRHQTIARPFFSSSPLPHIRRNGLAGFIDDAMSLTFAHLWQREALADVTVVLKLPLNEGSPATTSSPADRVISKVPGHAAVLSSSPYFLAQVGARLSRLSCSSATAADQALFQPVSKQVVDALRVSQRLFIVRFLCLTGRALAGTTQQAPEDREQLQTGGHDNFGGSRLRAGSHGSFSTNVWRQLAF